MGFLQELRKSMALSTPYPFVLSFLMVFFILQTPTFAAPQSYIVYMGMPSYDASDYLYQDEKVTKSHFDLLATYLNRDEEIQKQMLYSYTRSINGFAAILNDSQAAAMERNPEVLAVFPNRERKLHTTHSWRFLGLENNGGSPSHGSLWDNAKFGEDVIIGNLDTGVWPESESFNDEGMGPIPSKWNGICQSEGKVRCNKKLIGARYFYKGFEAQNGRLSPDKVSARDTEGHGSHTLSTAGGSFVPGASVFGIGNGTAKGGSPKARVAAYKVCWPAVGGGGCYDADILAAFDAAITDGVDVISVSLGGPPFEFFQDGTSLGSFQAMKRGISVVISAGNEGPDPYSVKNVAPWLLTVGASTMDRDFTSFVTLGNKKRLKGQSLSDKSLQEGKFYPLINSADAALPNASSAESQFCKSRSLDPKKVAGKILICLRGDNSRVEKGHEAALAGAVGMILANDPLNGNGIVADPHVLPASHLTFTDGEVVYDYIKNTTNPTASISPVKTVLGTKPAPVMADFTSRGPNVLDEAILKPDITAPGVNVIAAYTKAAAPTSGDYDNRRVPFITMSGTSMACPHVSGIVGLLKSIHPDWSPAAIKSAIMTTAKSRANNRKAILDSNLVDANAFAYGSGHVHPNHAADPGLVYDLTVDDYLNYLCGRGYNQTTLRAFSKRKYECPKDFSMANFNYPSISVPQLNGPTTVTRTVKNVGDPGTYTVEVREPVAVSVDVEPNSLTFAKVGEEKTYKVTLKPTAKGQPKAYTFGHLTWSDGKHRVTSPLVVKHK